MGVLEVALDTNFGPLEHWVHKSDYSCGKQLVRGRPYSSWPFVKDTAYLTIPPDSFFHFMVRLFPNDTEQCDSAVSASRWLSTQVLSFQRECGAINAQKCIGSKGLMDLSGQEWAFLQVHRSSPLQNDLFEAFTEINGRGVLLRWQRVASSPVEFDFGAYCRRQFGGAILRESAS